MEQKKLYRILEDIIKEAPKIDTDEELLGYVLQQIINNEQIHIFGGRIWKLSEDKKHISL
ncbi:MAG: hypothetical protein R2942_15735 [Ignavibacteria bacterium]